MGNVLDVNCVLSGRKEKNIHKLTEAGPQITIIYHHKNKTNPSDADVSFKWGKTSKALDQFQQYLVETMGHFAFDKADTPL